MKQHLWAVMQADHDLVFELLEMLTGGADRPQGSPEQHRRLARELVALESVHEAAEQIVIWPAVRKRCQNGDELILEATSQEREAKRALNELDRINAGTTEFEACVDTVASHARSHITYEQNQIWLRLDDAITDGDAERLAARYQAARRRAPTRPHAHTPPLPSVLATFGTVMAGFDRARDALTGRQVPGR
jgi:hypothetical protein